MDKLSSVLSMFNLIIIHDAITTYSYFLKKKVSRTFVLLSVGLA